MGKWATILQWGKKAMNHPAAEATGRSIGGAIIHPQRTLTGIGKATKTAVVGGSMGYLAWENIVNDKPVVRAAADVLVGEETVEQGIEMAGAATEQVEHVVEKAEETLQGVRETATSMNESWSGMGNFLKNIFGGNGTDMFGNFFSNLGRGNVSGLSILGLIASALLVFGRFGWLGKIAGAVLGMMLIGNNSHVARVQTETVRPEQPDRTPVQSGGLKR